MLYLLTMVPGGPTGGSSPTGIDSPSRQSGRSCPIYFPSSATLRHTRLQFRFLFLIDQNLLICIFFIHKTMYYLFQCYPEEESNLNTNLYVCRQPLRTHRGSWGSRIWCCRPSWHTWLQVSVGRLRLLGCTCWNCRRWRMDPLPGKCPDDLPYGQERILGLPSLEGRAEGKE